MSNYFPFRIASHDGPTVFMYEPGWREGRRPSFTGAWDRPPTATWCIHCLQLRPVLMIGNEPVCRCIVCRRFASR